ncbi:hypothetical protein [Helicobacter pylori]|uniref:hypothetical protein n=1 Tax=Helicobacter pylori TaxID=210 RepID=UPI0015E7FA92|nr:hypothetical protein [Helicobacter pylori]
MIVLRNAQSLFKRVRNSFKRVRISHQASGIFLITACKRPKTQGQPRFYKQTLEFLEKMVAKHLS